MPSSGEDVFPLWLVRKLAYSNRELHKKLGLEETEPQYVEHTYDNLDSFVSDLSGVAAPGERASGRRVVGATPTGRKLPDVCVTCNGGWMSRLESAAGLLMPGIMLGKQKLLAPYDQVVLATWMVKTCLTYDASREPRFIPEDVGSRLFFDAPFPPRLTHVKIGYDADYMPDGSLVHGKQPLTLSTDETAEPNAARFAFQFDHLIFQAVINYGDDLRSSGVGIKLRDSANFEQIWPEQTRLLWPSDALLARTRSLRATEEMMTEPPEPGPPKPPRRESSQARGGDSSPSGGSPSQSPKPPSEPSEGA